MAYRYQHLHLLCSDLKRMENFFTDALGAKLVERREFRGADGAVVDLNGIRINLRVSREGEVIAGDSATQRYGFDHLGLEVDDLDAAFEDLTRRGYLFTTPPTKTETGQMAFLKGPDNITIELIQS